MNNMFHEFYISMKLAVKNLRSNFGRTVLTLLGVVIGITSVIVITSSGQGVKSFILGQISSFGTDIIQVEIKVPATGHTSHSNALGQAMGINITTLKIKDAEEVAKLPNIVNYYAGTTGQEILSYQGNNKRALLFGASASAPALDQNLKIADGSFYSDSDDKGLAQVAVIGADIKDALFGEAEALGKEIKIGNKNFRVVGILERRGTVTFFNFDEIVYVPIRTLQKKILGVDYIRFFIVKVTDEALLDETEADILAEMRRLHDIDDPEKDDFAIMSIKEAQEIISDVFGTINILLLALTSISLIVGGVGIMNVMYVAVVERTFEIGLRKAVGAKSQDVLKQFLLEAIFITIGGGITGIALGFIFSFALSKIFSYLGFDLVFMITWQSVTIAFLFSAAVGIIFGFYPARKASQLSPMEAIRKE